MNKFLLFIFFSFTINAVVAQVKIGSLGAPNANAVLELDGGTNKGLLLPKLAGPQIAALTTAPDGLLIYNITDGFIYIRKAGVWRKLSDETSGGLVLPYSGAASTTAFAPAFKVQNTGAGIGITGDAAGGFGVVGTSNTGTGGLFASTSGPALVTGTGNVGIGTPIGAPPAFPLDIVGRVQLRNKGGESPGIWFEKISTPLAQSSFFGVVNDSTVGLYSGKNNRWQFFFNHDNNNFGILNANPRSPLSFQSLVGRKIDMFYQSETAMYGLGVQAAELQLYTNDNTAHTSIGYGSSEAFTETFRVNSGSTVTVNPIGIIPGAASANYFKLGNSYGGAIKTIFNGIFNGGGSRMSFFTGSSTDINALAERMTISNAGKVGIGLPTPSNPLSFPATLEKKISLYPGATGDVGLAVSGNELRLYGDNPNAVTTIGYDDFTNGFTEIYKVDPNGITTLTTPVNHAANVQTTTYFKSANAYTGAIKMTGTGSTSSRMGLYTFTTANAASLRESVTILDAGNVGINTITPNSRLQVEGSVSMAFRSLTANYTATDNDYTLFYDVDAIGSIVATVTLPAAANRKGRIYVVAASIPYRVQGGGISGAQYIYINNEFGNNVFEDNPGLQDPNGSTYDCLMNYKFTGLTAKRKLSVTFQSDGVKWRAIDNSFQY
jgi:hypothetical protein